MGNQQKNEHMGLESVTSRAEHEFNQHEKAPLPTLTPADLVARSLACLERFHLIDENEAAKQEKLAPREIQHDQKLPHAILTPAELVARSLASLNRFHLFEDIKEDSKFEVLMPRELMNRISGSPARFAFPNEDDKIYEMQKVSHHCPYKLGLHHPAPMAAHEPVPRANTISHNRNANVSTCPPPYASGRPLQEVSFPHTILVHDHCSFHRTCTGLGRELARANKCELSDWDKMYKVDKWAMTMGRGEMIPEWLQKLEYKGHKETANYYEGLELARIMEERGMV